MVGYISSHFKNNTLEANDKFFVPKIISAANTLMKQNKNSHRSLVVVGTKEVE
jgi:hypothetical protein